MVAGGTGITPMYQFITHALEESTRYNLSLLFANKTESDIILRQELDKLNADGKVKVRYTVDNGNDSWKGYTRFVSEQMFRETFPQPSNDHLLMVCGPPLMIKDVLIIAAKLGFQNENIALF